MRDASTPTKIPPQAVAPSLPGRRGPALLERLGPGDPAGTRPLASDVFVAKAESYELDLAAIIRGDWPSWGSTELDSRQSVLLKPNLVERRRRPLTSTRIQRWSGRRESPGVGRP